MSGARLATVFVAFSVAAGLSDPRAARAQDVYTVRPAEVPFGLVALAISLLPQLDGGDAPPARCLPDCRRSNINVIDRWAVGHRSDFAETLSNVLIVAMPLAAIGIDVFDVEERGLVDDAGVAVEAFATHALLLAFTKFTFRRLRPYVYDETLSVRARSSPESTLSFFSGHSSSAFVTAVTFGETYRRRHDGIGPILVYSVGLTLATVVAACRILAGKHFLTDVLAGALVGVFAGILIPAAHDNSD